MELNREQIIEAIKCCIKSDTICESGCPLFDENMLHCVENETTLLKYALVVIEELTEENERVRAVNKKWKELYLNVKKTFEGIYYDDSRDYTQPANKQPERFKFFKRLIYWIKNPHKKACRDCCLFCKFYDTCKDDKE